MSKSEYLKLADTVAAEIAEGTLKPGDRLPPQRNFAFERKIAVSTASRVYAELLRRGLVVGEVGRGTFISACARRCGASEPRGIRIDLEFNYPMLPDQTALIAKSLEGLEKPGALDAALRQATSVGTPAVRSVAAIPVAGRMVPRPRTACVHRQRAAEHCRRARRSCTHGRPLRRGGFDLPLHQGDRRPARYFAGAAGDGRRRRPAHPVQKAHREAHLSAIYIQPAVQNPLGMTMPPTRRADSCALSKSSTFRSSRTMSTASSTMSRRLPRSRRNPASSSTASPRRSLPAWRLASSCRRSGCVKA